MMYQTDFSKETFCARREKVFAAIGPQAVALIQGAAKNPTHDLFFQNNDFYYLCGVESPHAYLLLDGASQTATLYLAHQSAQRAAGEGRPSVAPPACPGLGTAVRSGPPPVEGPHR